MWKLWVVILGVLALACVVIGLVQRHQIKNTTFRKDGKPDERTGAFRLMLGIAIAVVFALLAGLLISDNVSADTNDSKGKSHHKQTIDLASFQVCPKGVNVKHPTYYVRGKHVDSPQAVTPPLPRDNPDGVIIALYGVHGYACKDPSVAAAMAMVQPGILPFTEQDDANELQDWVALFAKDGESWLKYVKETAKRFDGLVWQPDWRPKDGDATFLISDPNNGQPQPLLVQRNDAPPKPWGAYHFAESYQDSPLLTGVVLVAEFGWLALPEGQFSRCPVIQVQPDQQPLFPPQENKSSDGQTSSGGGKDNGDNKGQAQDKGGHSSGGCGQCQGQSGATSPGSGTTGCGGQCPGQSGASAPGSGNPGCNCGGNTPTTTPKSPLTTPSKPTTTVRPPTTTSPPPTTRPTVPPTTVRPTTTTTAPPRTTTTLKPAPQTTTTVFTCPPATPGCG